MGWLIYVVVVLAAAGLAGRHVGRFREACTGMTGMMVGMTMGMMTGFVLGYGAAAATNSMFWGNAFGILFGLALGVYYGRSGGLMGMMDGGMGGVMGGSMGAMLAVMVRYPEEALLGTAALLTAVFVLSMVALAALVEQNSPEDSHLHLVLPLFNRRGVARAETEDLEPAVPAPATRRKLTDYYALLDVDRGAGQDEIYEAYLAAVESPTKADPRRLERALAVLSDPRKREAYDRLLVQQEDAAAPATEEDCPKCEERKPPAATRTATPAAAATAGSAGAKVPAANGGAGAARTGGQSRGSTSPQASPRAQSNAGGGSERSGPSTGALIVGVAGGLLLASALALKLLAPASAPPAAATPYEIGHAPAPIPSGLQGVAAPVAPDGKQTLDIVIDGNTMSYKPNVIEVKQGQPVRFNLSTAGRDPGCGRLVVIRGLGVNGVATPGQVTTMEFTPDAAGTFEINCGMQMMQAGYLVVTN